ncbi:MAG: DnaJ domain-containing protein [Acidobacteria bacterium]|nr:DnaJ domain-containing protein [Acidobacteriota bacterium]
MKDYYRLLGVSPSARLDEIKTAYRRLARQHHPDMTGANGPTAGDRFRDLTRAYEMLADEESRRRYDATLASRRRDEPARAPDHQWFNDEVAIDFPSIQAVLERMRESFFGADERTAPLSAEIWLTSREARSGVTVPLEVPVRFTCSACGGRGEVWMEMCPRCGGTGAALCPHLVRLFVPRGVRHGARFRFSVTPPCALSTHVEIRIAIEPYSS